MVRKFVILVFVACRRDWFCGALSGNGGCGCRLRGSGIYILAMPVKVVNTSVIRARHRARMVLEATTERGCPK